MLPTRKPDRSAGIQPDKHETPCTTQSKKKTSVQWLLWSGWWARNVPMPIPLPEDFFCLFVSQASFGDSEISVTYCFQTGTGFISKWFTSFKRKHLNENVQLSKAPALRLDHLLSCISTLEEQPCINNEPGTFSGNGLSHLFIVLNVFYFQIASE